MKLTVTKGRRGETRLQSGEYVPPGPVRIARRTPRPVLKRPYSVGVSEEKRVPGRLYDAISGVELRIASDEEKAEHAARVPYEVVVGGTKMKVVVW